MGSKSRSPASPSVPKPSYPRRTSKDNGKDIEWSKITDPEERRRVQNRIAQRKFREKAKESKEKAERDTRNHANAANSYRIPSPQALQDNDFLSGLPWGSVNLNLVVSRGHEAESRRSSGRETCAGDDSRTSSHHSQASFSMPPPLPQSNCESAMVQDEVMYDDSMYMFQGGSAFPYYSP